MRQAKVKGGYPDAYLFLDLKPLSKQVSKRHLAGSQERSQDAELRDSIEASYEGLQGEWLEWLEVAKRYEVKVPTGERLDIRHTILLRLATVRQKTDQPIPLYRAYRIASYSIADYYRQEGRLNTGLDCKHCSTAQRRQCRKHNLYSECPKLIKLVSLDDQWVGSDGQVHSLLDTVADDQALDLDDWVDCKTWLEGCPTRLVEIALKVTEGKPLNAKDRKYLSRYRKKTQISLL